jgi:hypothetical protein
MSYELTRSCDGTSVGGRRLVCEQARNVIGNSLIQKLSCKLHQAGNGKVETDSLLQWGLQIAPNGI